MSQLTVDSTATWKQRLEGRVPPRLDEEIDIFETQIAQKRQGKIDDKVFAETRLRRGVYGQRYDNGQRHDGTASRALEYPCGDLTKGPNTVWDAPGMLRIKIPFGAMNGEQMEVLADLAEEYSDGIAHVTTRQDIQLHFIHIDDTPDIMRRLAAVGITTQEACGNSVRNVTACPLAGVCRDEPFDVSPYAHAMTHFLLGHRDAQDFGRKFKIAFSGCEQHACGLANMHDLGVVAQVRKAGNGTSSDAERGFRVYVGGGLGAVPHQAKVLREFVREDELLPLAQAVCRVFGRLGEKRNRARARVKFLVAKLGIEEFTRLVDEELAVLPADDRWTAYLDDLSITDEAPTRPAATLEPGPRPEGFAEWLGSNVQRQRQPGYVTVAVNLPLGDLTSTQLRDLADTARRYNGGLVRNTVEQNIVLRNISEANLPALYVELRAAGLGAPGASSLVDVTACPGTDTCKLGISASRGLAGELRKRIATSIRTTGVLADEAVKDLRIKVSGCFNSCGQHHVADIGFYGVSRKSDGRTVPHFQVILGGQWTENAGSYGLAVVAVPAKRIPEAVERIVGLYVAEREKGETFQSFIARVGKARVRQLLDDLTKLPTYLEDRNLYSDWGDPREYTIGDLGVGECAGEVVTAVEFGLSAAEREVFQGLLELDRGQAEGAAAKAYTAMLQAARALITTENIDIGTAPQEIVDEFRTRFYDSELFFDPYAGAKFANYLFRVHGDPETASGEEAHRRIEEAQLFIEAAHACNQRISQAQVADPLRRAV
ncbi:MAG: nitrite/sulfite reductase [Acidobacteria bacterium]|nr:nitrite/sulfite reductase [Acidobacteriota bacterium]